MKKKIIIMGAAGRDFHNFNMCFKDNPGCEVVAFTAAQIPFIYDRTFPKELAGPLYPHGIPIYPEERLEELIRSNGIDTVVFSYSDVSHEYVMRRASLCVANNADFILLGAEKTMLESGKPVISVCAVRTGCGKSGVTRFIGRTIMEAGKTPVAIRHPMPYGDLLREKTQRFKNLSDIKATRCTIEEMEEFEPLVNAGLTVYAGVDYREILKEAEKEADVIIWDGGNNDLPFIKPDIEIVVVDPLRPGHELRYFPGEANLRRAGLVIINKADSALPNDLEAVRNNIKAVNPSAKVITTASTVKTDARHDMAGKRVLVIEDGPTLTHGGMSYGAGIVAAKTLGALPVDPMPYAVGTIKETLLRYPHLKNLLPATGYSEGQIKELEETINKTPCDALLIATPVNLANVINIKKPVIQITYEVTELEKPGLTEFIKDFLKGIA